MEADLDRLLLALLEVDDPRLLVMGLVGVVFVLLLRAWDLKRIDAMRAADLKHIDRREQILRETQQALDAKTSELIKIQAQEIVLLKEEKAFLKEEKALLKQQVETCEMGRRQQGKDIEAQNRNLRNLRQQIIAERKKSSAKPKCRHEPPNQTHP